MQKAKKYDIEDSNIALLGSDLDKKAREAAAATEKAWVGAGQKIGLEIWRIEKFQVVRWPKDQYGSFFSGDSYILLNTYKKQPDSPALAWDVHFWLGKDTTQDEAGTAAYKTVELDDLLKGAPVQHREVQGHESDLFLKYFNNQIRLMDGGVDSGFKHVEPEKYKSRLLHLKGKKKVRVTEVAMSHKSLNSGDVFILDAGLNIYQWNGKKAGPMEKNKGAQIARALNDERRGAPRIHVIEEREETGEDVETFWTTLGGKGYIMTAEEGGSDEEAERGQVRKLFRLSDATGKMEFTLVGEGVKIRRDQLDTNDVFIFDSGAEVFAWIGLGASADERKKAMQYAQDYLAQFQRPAFIPISRILEGGENEVFEALFR